ncbi:hypothetical protein B0J13DRAFT_96184 [Dactylonectria estremocensis]|uniref:Uncharacterized protein n=1 Tax=Dactylonectria estremocensis TaxID=1079267 RepID=A0A9P9E9Q7_9HYPO|nr:hypothetical protein B0J13DRAFT_96184 [Dactylonectria estremocensis]
MSRRCYVDTDADGRPQFVAIKRSQSYRHHSHRHNCDYYTVSREDWKALAERNRALEEANQAFGLQNDSLRASLSSAQAESHHLNHTVIPQLQEQVVILSADNEALRRSIDSSNGSSVRTVREIAKLRHKVCKLEKENQLVKDENSDLRVRLHELSKQVDQGVSRRISELTKEIEYWSNQRRFWKSKYEELLERYNGMCTILDTKTEKVEVYEDILRRHRII